MTAPILTLTMNPALDVWTTIDHVVSERKLRCGPSRFDPGGGGVNVTRAIRNLGGDSVAVYPLGGPTGQAYRGYAEAAGVFGHIVAIADDTRQSFTVNERSSGEEYRFVLQGPRLHESEWRTCLHVVQEHLPVGGYLVASGSLPPGVPTDFYAMLARLGSAHGVRVVVDASGPPLEAALAEGVYLITPSLDELAAISTVRRGAVLDEQIEAARTLVRTARIELVALTMGAAGALLVTATDLLRLPTPAVQVSSTVGAGDAFLAGLVLRLAEGRSIRDAFRTAVAAGTATAMLPATDLCRAEDVARLELELLFA